ncbi:MAG: amino acid-binding protein [Desulfobulbaceae bacterium A2]|nr:MAG: amino acid-binding protein [Desulfobulbaceae bacterium A2]
MQVEQLAVFLENKSGRLAEITHILADKNINIRALSVADTADFGILRLIVDRVDEAKLALKEGGFTVGKTQVVAVEVPDRPGGLAGVLHVVEDAGLNVEYMYAFVNGSGAGQAILIFRFDSMLRGIEALRKAGIRIVSDSEIRTM